MFPLRRSGELLVLMKAEGHGAPSSSIALPCKWPNYIDTSLYITKYKRAGHWDKSLGAKCYPIKLFMSFAIANTSA